MHFVVIIVGEKKKRKKFIVFDRKLNSIFNLPPTEDAHGRTLGINTSSKNKL